VLSEEAVSRRLAAILAADVAGYSRLMEADEEGTLARLRGLRRDLIDPKIALWKGRIEKGSRSRTWSCTVFETKTAPGSAKPSRRAARLSTASRTLANSTSMPSPVVLTTNT
jgi:hypothetical protein